MLPKTFFNTKCINISREIYVSFFSFILQYVGAIDKVSVFSSSQIDLEVEAVMEFFFLLMKVLPQI